MTSVLIEHAKKHVWQEPEQDHQYNISLPRLTTAGGFVGSTEVGWHRVLSPEREQNPRRRFHVYQIGQLASNRLNLENILVEDEWMLALDIVNKYNVLIQVYLLSGAMIPLSHVYLMRDFTNNLLVCIYNDTSINLGVDETYIDEITGVVSPRKITLDNSKAVVRFYSNALQENLHWNATSHNPTDSVEVVTSVIATERDYHVLTNQLAQVRNKYNNRGSIMMFLDGFLHLGGSSFHNDFIGKRVSFIYDETIYIEQSFELEHLAVFKSIKNKNRNKYLLLMDKEYDVIDHFDDIDFYLVNNKTKQGVFISRTHDWIYGQVAHNAYSLDAETVQYYLRLYNWLGDIRDCRIHVFVRKGGMQKGVFHQGNRIDELFRLPYEQLNSIFTNNDSLIDAWRASELENSAYMKLISSKGHEITEDMVADGYGYSAIVSNLMTPIHKVENGKFNLPDGFLVKDTEYFDYPITVFCYNAEGEYIGWFTGNKATSTVVIPNSVGFDPMTVTTVEVFRLRGFTARNTRRIYMNEDYWLNEMSEYGHRCYVSPVVNGEPTYQWIDVTGSDYYTFTKRKLFPAGNRVDSINWNKQKLTDANLIGCFMVGSEIIIQEESFSNRELNHQGFLRIPIKNRWGDGRVLRYSIAVMPHGNYELFINGKSMIEGIDYYLEFPYIIVNNHHVLQQERFNAMIRAYGFVDSETCRPHKPKEIGFVRQGYLSIDGEYDISKNRANKVVVNSKLVDKSSLKFSEYQGDGELYNPDGRPYAIIDYRVPIGHLCNRDATEMYNQMNETDDKLGRYITRFFKDPDTSYPRAVTNRWLLVSPLMNALLHEIKRGNLTSINRTTDFTITEVHELMLGYEWLLKFDPAHQNIDPNYTDILPHHYYQPMEATLNQYQLLELINELYLNKRIDLTKYVIVR